jgi:hypothetical protein
MLVFPNIFEFGHKNLPLRLAVNIETKHAMELCDGLLSRAVRVGPVITDRNFGLQRTGVRVSNLMTVSWRLGVNLQRHDADDGSVYRRCWCAKVDRKVMDDSLGHTNCALIIHRLSEPLSMEFQPPCCFSIRLPESMRVYASQGIVR